MANGVSTRLDKRQETRGATTFAVRSSVPHFYPRQVLTPFSNARNTPSLVDVVHRVYGGHELKGSCEIHWLEGCVPGALRTLKWHATPHGQGGSPGRRPFLLGPLSTSYPTYHCLQWSEQTEMALIQQKTKTFVVVHQTSGRWRD